MCHIAFTYGHYPPPYTHIHIRTQQLPFPRKRDVLNYLMTIPVHTDDELQLASMEIEPPENSGEKKRYQELK